MQVLTASDRSSRWACLSSSWALTSSISLLNSVRLGTGVLRRVEKERKGGEEEWGKGREGERRRGGGQERGWEREKKPLKVAATPTPVAKKTYPVHAWTLGRSQCHRNIEVDTWWWRDNQVLRFKCTLLRFRNNCCTKLHNRDSKWPPAGTKCCGLSAHDCGSRQQLMYKHTLLDYQIISFFGALKN